MLVQVLLLKDLSDVSGLDDQCLATAMHATRVASHGLLNDLLPRALVFRCNKHLDIPLTAIAVMRVITVYINSLLQSNQVSRYYRVGDVSGSVFTACGVREFRAREPEP
jgi:hypothetical protein